MCSIPSIYTFQFIIVYTQLQKRDKQNSYRPRWARSVASCLLQVRTIAWDYASVLWWTCLQCIHIHRRRMSKTRCHKNSQSHTCPAVAWLGYESCEDGGTGGRSATVVDSAIIDSTPAPTVNLIAVPLLSLRAPFVSSPAQELVRELGRRQSPTADAITAGTRSSASSYQRLSVVVRDQGHRRMLLLSVTFSWYW